MNDKDLENDLVDELKQRVEALTTISSIHTTQIDDLRHSIQDLKETWLMLERRYPGMNGK